MKFSNHEQGSEEWFAERRGAITASMFSTALDSSDGLTDQQRAYVEALRSGATKDQAKEAAGYKSAPSFALLEAALAGRLPTVMSAACKLYAMDVARERLGGSVFGRYTTAQMRYGTEQEPEARIAYEMERGVIVQEVGFFKTDDSLFGCSVDGLVNDDGGIEIKVLASSDVLFEVLVNKDYSSFIDQVNAPLWLLRRQWWDLVLWTPDLPKKLHVVRFERNEEQIAALEAGLIAFEAVVSGYEAALREAMK